MSEQREISKGLDSGETGNILNCPKHGDYPEKYLIFGTMKKIFKECPVCSKEREDARKAAEEKKEQERQQSIRYSHFIDRGVTRRNYGKTFDTYKTGNPNQASALEKTRAFADRLVSNENAGNLLLLGNVGTGKTHLATAICEHVYQKHSFRIARLIEIIRNVKETWSKDSKYTEQSVLDYYGDIDLLIIDEVGIQFGSESEKMFIFDIINQRYENVLPTVLISNLNLDGVKSVLGDQAVDRLREDGATVVNFSFESQRGKFTGASNEGNKS